MVFLYKFKYILYWYKYDLSFFFMIYYSDEFKFNFIGFLYYFSMKGLLYFNRIVMLC